MATTSTPFANFGNYFDVEVRSNALWNSILLRLYGAPLAAVGNIVVIPEDYPRPNSRSGKKLDLVVRRLVPQIHAPAPSITVTAPRIVLEGKGAGKESFGAIAEQLRNWCLLASGYKGCNMWCIGVQGQLVKFAKFASYMDFRADVRGVRVGEINEVVWKDGLAPVAGGVAMPAYDTAIPEQMRIIDQVLVFMRDNPP